MGKIVHPELSYKITGLCFQVQKELGRFCREKQYADKFEELLKESGVNYNREYEIKNFNSMSPDGNIVDFLIEDKIIVDLKAKIFINKDDYFQMQRYLEGADLELGMIINFRNYYLKPKRVLNSKSDTKNHNPIQVIQTENTRRFGLNLGHSDRLRGFTLIEILIVVALIGILAMVVFVSMADSKKSTQEKKFLSEITAILPDVLLCKEAGKNVRVNIDSTDITNINRTVCGNLSIAKYPDLPNSNWLYGNKIGSNACAEDFQINDSTSPPVADNGDFTICAYGEWTNPALKNSTATKVIKCSRIGCEKLGW